MTKKAIPSSIFGGMTETSAALREGIPAITLDGMDEHGIAPYWHTLDDTYDKMDPEVMLRAYEFTWKFIAAIDSKLLGMHIGYSRVTERGTNARIG